jgi:predicted acylesterase/phospholipase RssA
MTVREQPAAHRRGWILALVWWIACCASLLVLSAACARQSCPGCKHPNPLTVGCPYPDTELAAAFETRALATPIDQPTLLILSGGASHGAWGAGVITGWSTAPTPRPNFTVVTGISTGALQAPFAFLGTTQDGKLKTFYTTTTNSDIYDVNWSFLWSNSLQSREPLRQIINNNVTKDVVLAIAAETNRELFVGTVNLDTSQFCPWNLSTIARKAEAANNDGDAQKTACWVKLIGDAIFAASGAPVIAPPVEIDSNACTGGPPQRMLHVDGGIRARIFVADVVERAIDAGLTPTAYVIMNGKLTTHPECVENRLLGIAMRTFEIIDHEALFGSLYALMAKHAPANQPPKLNLRLSRVPDSYCLGFPGSEFDPVKMTCLFNRGETWVQQANPWETTIPVASATPWPPDPNCCRPLGKCPDKICVPPTGCSP